MDRERECVREMEKRRHLSGDGIIVNEPQAVEHCRTALPHRFHVVHAVTPIPRSKSPLHLSLPPGINQNAMAASREKIRTVADSYLARQLQVQVPKINKHVPSGSRSLRGAAAADEVAL